MDKDVAHGQQADHEYTAHGTAQGPCVLRVDQFGVPHLLYDGLDIMVARGMYDDVRLVEIDTPDVPEDPHGPICRIYLNDEVQYENPPFVAPEE